MKVNSCIIRLMLCVLMLILVVTFYFYLYFLEENKLTENTEQDKIQELNFYNNIKNIMDNSEIQARAVSVYDLSSNKKLYSKNDQEKLPLASLSKIMTAIVSLEDSQTNSITVTKKALRQFGEYGLKENEVWLKNDLIKLSLVTSSNDAAFALAEGDQDFINKMNKKAITLNMYGTSFINPTGLDIDKYTPSAYGSAEDINKLATYALDTYPYIFTATAVPVVNLTSTSGFSHVLNNTNLSLSKIPNILFSKTGLTETAGGNLTVIFEDINKHKIAITILGSTQIERFSDIEKIVGILYNTHKYE